MVVEVINTKSNQVIVDLGRDNLVVVPPKYRGISNDVSDSDISKFKDKGLQIRPISNKNKGA